MQQDERPLLGLKPTLTDQDKEVLLFLSDYLTVGHTYIHSICFLPPTGVQYGTHLRES
jgi:hypothetical protein